MCNLENCNYHRICIANSFFRDFVRQMRRDEHLLSGGGGNGGGRGGKGKLNRQLYVSKVFWSYDYCIT